MKLDDLKISNIMDRYAITQKIDGTRKFLFCYKTGIYLVGMNSRINKVSDNNIQSICVFEGELIENRFYVYDCIYYDGSEIQSKNHVERLKLFDRIKNLKIGPSYNSSSAPTSNNQKNYELIKKEFIILRNNNFFILVNQLLNYNKEPIDGLMFTYVKYAVINEENDISRQREEKEKKEQDMYQRTIDTLKWKPELTIDFFITYDNNEIKLYYGVKPKAKSISPKIKTLQPKLIKEKNKELIQSSNQLINESINQSINESINEPILEISEGIFVQEFKGTDKESTKETTKETDGMIYEFTSNDVLMSEKLKNANNKIVELRWNFNIKKFEFLRLRSDRIYPNSKEIVMDLWEDIQRPILEKTIRGEQFNFIFYYHDYLKTLVYQTFSKNYKSAIVFGYENPLKLMKYNFTKILYVVDDITKFQSEMFEKLVNSGNIKVLQVKANEIDKIYAEYVEFFGNIENKVDAIFHYSIGNYYANENDLRVVLTYAVQLIKSKGFFVPFFLNELDVIEYFNELIRTNPVIEQLGEKIIYKSNLTQIEFNLQKYNEETKVYYRYPNNDANLVSLVNFEVLSKYLNQFNFEVSRIVDDNIYLLNPEEKIFSNLFSFFMAKNNQ